MAGPREDTSRIPFHEASRVLLRTTILDAMRTLLLDRDWSAITMSDVARTAGISRQTLYKEFSSRQGLAQGYALRLVDEFVDAVADSVHAHVGDARGALVDGFTSFFAASAADPLVRSLLDGAAKPDLLRLITTDAAPILERGGGRLSETFVHSWIAAPEADADILARAIVRVALSFISMPPTSGADVAADLADLLVPFVERATVADR
ncbi:MAG: TetR/AcrR family transcriptional regulator [Rhodococcus sp.]|uniref:TetR family transcriptional regulator n=1 Tax=Rhodococcus TaxID=1827 RepID=UPI00168F38EB|nr:MULTISPECIES: TetR family transcriptional regulator [Rhodococcus]NLV80851.1 TetR/AcrR family transcriptional regulator [Rhodococcus sp. (in: high G+C Gram-positive bacteria)]